MMFLRPGNFTLLALEIVYFNTVKYLLQKVGTRYSSKYGIYLESDEFSHVNLIIRLRCFQRWQILKVNQVIEATSILEDSRLLNQYWMSHLIHPCKDHMFRGETSTSDRGRAISKLNKSIIFFFWCNFSLLD